MRRRSDGGSAKTATTPEPDQSNEMRLGVLALFQAGIFALSKTRRQPSFSIGFKAAASRQPTCWNASEYNGEGRGLAALEFPVGDAFSALSHMVVMKLH